MATCFTSALTFNFKKYYSLNLRLFIRLISKSYFLLFFLSLSLRANFYDGKWTYHDKDKNVVFENMPVIDDLPWLRLSDIVARFHLKIKDEGGGALKITEDKSQRQVTINTRHNEVSGFWGKISLSSIPKRVENDCLVPLDFGDRVLRPLLEGEAPKHPFPTPETVQADLIIDAGHGGNDWGTEGVYRGQKFFEKNLTLEIARELKREIEKKSYKVLLTRDDDVYLGLSERANFANRNRSNLFLSIHLNYEPQSKLKGYEIYILSLKANDLSESHKALLIENMKIPTGKSADMAQNALQELKAEIHFKESLGWARVIDGALSKSHFAADKKSIKMGPFYLLYSVEMPSVLLELAYLNNPKDIENLVNHEKRSKVLAPLIEDLAKTLKKGIVRAQ